MNRLPARTEKKIDEHETEESDAIGAGTEVDKKINQNYWISAIYVLVIKMFVFFNLKMLSITVCTHP